MKICVVGAGRVGLPLACVLAQYDHEVSVCDKSKAVVSELRLGIAPFKEPHLQTWLNNFGHAMKFSTVLTSEADAFIVCVPTPVTNGEANLSAIFKVLDTLALFNLTDKLVIIRSTLPPGGTAALDSYLFSATFANYKIAYCPERIAEDHAIEELMRLPQLIGCRTSQDFKAFEYVFNFAECIKTTWEEAEAVKLFTNTYRYAHFAISNYLSMTANKLGLDFDEVFSLMTRHYPRLDTMPLPGLTGGSCLRKDYAMLSKLWDGADVGVMANKINEQYAVDIANRAIDMSPLLRIGILGATFKAGSSNIKDSLVAVVANHILQTTGVKPKIHDPHLVLHSSYSWVNGYSFINVSMEELAGCETVVIGTSHPQFDKLEYRSMLANKIVLDPTCQVSQLHLEDY